MATANLLILESDHDQFSEVLGELRQDANAKLVFLLDKAGRQIASCGSLEDIDPTALASLTAGNVAATEGVAELVGEGGFTSQFHEGKHGNLHISVVGGRIILLVVFDERSSLGLVRLRVDKSVPQLVTIMDEIQDRVASNNIPNYAAAFAEITDEDIDALFG